MALGERSCIVILRYYLLLVHWDVHQQFHTQVVISRIPCVTILSRSNCPATEDYLILHKIFFAAREDGAVDDEELSSNLSVRYDDEELIAHPDRKQRTIFLCPSIDG